MCELCDSDQSSLHIAKQAMYYRAERLQHLASLYDKLASGDIKPHTKEAEAVGIVAKSIIRILVEEWV